MRYSQLTRNPKHQVIQLAAEDTTALAETSGNATGVQQISSPDNTRLFFLSSSLLSVQVLEGPWALSWVIQESMSLKYEPASEAGGSSSATAGGRRHPSSRREWPASPFHLPCALEERVAFHRPRARLATRGVLAHPGGAFRVWMPRRRARQNTKPHTLQPEPCTLNPEP